MMNSIVSNRDLRDTTLWKETETYFHNLLSPGFGEVTRALDLVASPDGKYLAFTGLILTEIESNPDSRICLLDISTKELKIVTEGPHHDVQAAFSPDGKYISFLSDRVKPGVLQPYLIPFANEASKAVKSLPQVSDLVEYHFWSPDSKHILLGVAGSGAEKSSALGSGKFEEDGVLPSWVPEVDTGVQGNQWRSLWVHDLESDQVSKISPHGLNVWDGNWCGNDCLVAVVSERPSEGAWYHAKLVTIDIKSGDTEDLLLPTSDRQFSKPVASPSGKHTATICALCSDRSVVAGPIHVIDMQTHNAIKIDTAGVEVTEIVWIDSENLFFSGLSGSQTVYGQVNTIKKTVKKFLSTEYGSGKWFPEAAFISYDKFATIIEGKTRPQEISVFENGVEVVVLSLAHAGTSWLQSQLGLCKPLSWNAADGLEIQGYLTLPPHGTAPYPLIVDVHGGPVWSNQNTWANLDIWAFYVSRGYAVLSPNPRGSAGRNQDFIRAIYGDMGGEDAKDILAGIDHLVDEGVVDTARVGITGRSYGGTMAVWIITQTARFAASVPIAAASDWRSQHTTSNIPEFDAIFLQSSPYEAGGEYHTRSALVHAGKYPTPVLQIVGKEDGCVPSSQGLQYHRGLLEKGVESVLMVYPGEAHGVRQFPAYFDYCVRAVAWFEQFMPAVTGQTKEDV